MGKRTPIAAVVSDRAHDYELWTDGGCSPNPGPGGFASMLISKSNGRRSFIVGKKGKTTNNEMEMTAIARGLAMASDDSTVKVFADSSLALGLCFMGWKTELLHLAQIQYNLHLLISNKRLKIIPTQVRGHVGIAHNEECDTLCTAVMHNAIALNGDNHEATWTTEA